MKAKTSDIFKHIQKTLYFINQRGKKYDSFNREDLCELNEYLIRDVQTMFKHSIPVRTLTSEEKAYLEVSEQGVEAFLCANPSLDLDAKLYDMKRQLQQVVSANDRFKWLFPNPY